MTKHTIVTLPGDGIGGVVLEQALQVLDAAGFSANTIEADIGWEFWCTQGDPLPSRTLDLLAEHKTGLFGAITSQPRNEAMAALAPELQGQGFEYTSPIVGLRQHFGLDICLRPCRSYLGNPLNFIRRGPGETIEEPEIDVVIFRQNTEGLYGGVEWTDPPKEVHQAFMTHPRFKKLFGDLATEALSISTRIFTRPATTRILTAAFDHARRYGYPSVTLCEKPNVIRETSGMMYRLAQELQRDQYPEIELWNTNIDAQMMWLTKNPENYGVIVAGNMFGDIVSDGFAGLIGGLGFAASAQVNPSTGVAVFEPTHGSAPKYAGYETSIVNPIAMIEAACLMLDHLEEPGMSHRIRQAVARVVSEGQVRTYDMARMSGGEQVLKQGAASTAEMTAAIIKALEPGS